MEAPPTKSMFRAVRGFLALAPLAFLAALLGFLLKDPAAADRFTPHPILTDLLGRVLSWSPIPRFSATATIFFAAPYLTVALLLFLSDLSWGSSARLWRTRAKTRPARAGAREEERMPPAEARWTLVVASLLLSAILGVLLHRVAHGGELPGGVNVAPLFVAAAPFPALFVALLLSALAAAPRAVHRYMTSKGTA